MPATMWRGGGGGGGGGGGRGRKKRKGGGGGGIEGIMGVAKAGEDVAGAAAVGERAGKTEENEIAAGHECGRQPARGDLDCRVAGECRVGDGGQRVELDRMVVAQAR